MSSLAAKTHQEIYLWVAGEGDPKLYIEKRLMLGAKTAMGDGAMEEQLIRLMVWVATRLRHEKTHSGIHAPLEILKDGRAWCEQYVAVFAFMAWHILGLPSRAYDLRHSDGVCGHTVVELEYSNTWHLFDPEADHQAIYRNDGGEIVSYADIVSAPAHVEAEAHWWTGTNGHGKVGFYRTPFPPVVYERFHERPYISEVPWSPM